MALGVFRQRIMPGNKVKCYSYIRWSSDQQATGTTLERQLKIARKIAAENGLELVELIDEGISAFKGKNRKEGALGDFIEAVKNGVIPANSWLVVENLDRLTRENISNAQLLFMELLGLGVTIVTGMDRRVYTYESVNLNAAEFIISILHFERAHQESKIKSDRTYANAEVLYDINVARERAGEEYAVAINSIGNNVWWSDCSDGLVKPHPYYFDVAREIIDLILKGWGNYRIAGYLNERYEQPIKKLERTSWSPNLIANFYKRRALIGEKTLNIKGVEYVLPNYYPKLVDEDTFYRLHDIKKNKISKSTATTNVPLASGLNILKCGECDGNMYAFTHRQKELRYICGTGQTNSGCRPWSFSATWLEDTLLRLAANHVFRPLDISKNFAPIEDMLVEKLHDKKAQAERLVDVLTGEDSPSPTVMKRLSSLEADIKEVQFELENVKLKKYEQKHETVEWTGADENVLDFKQHGLREGLKLRIASAVSNIKCMQVKARHIFFQITFINGKSITAYRTPGALAFDGGAWVKLGDHFGSKVPVSESEKAVLGMGEQEDTETSLYEDVQNASSDSELDELLAKHAIDPGEISGYDGYKYTGLYNVSMEMLEAYEKGEAPKELEADILRVQHLIEWADGMKGAPKIIEDQYQVYKHPSAKKVLKKERPGIYYVEGAKFASEVVPEWQRNGR